MKDNRWPNSVLLAGLVFVLATSVFAIAAKADNGHISDFGFISWKVIALSVASLLGIVMQKWVSTVNKLLAKHERLIERHEIELAIIRGIHNKTHPGNEIPEIPEK